MMIFAVRVVSGQEPVVAEMLEAKVKREGFNIYSIIYVPSIKGYVFVEAEDELTLRNALERLPYVRRNAIVPGKISEEEIENLVAAKPLMKILKPGMIVDVIAGPLKGERAKIVRVIEEKEEVVVESINAPVRIPVIIPASSIKIVHNAEQ